jgi:hypothetical protein
LAAIVGVVGRAWSVMVSGIRPGWRPVILPLWCAIGLVALVMVARAGSVEPQHAPAPVAAVAATDETARREAIRADVRGRFAKGDFAGLELLANRYRDTRSTTPSGLRELTLFYAGIHTLTQPLERDDTAGWQLLDHTLAAWRTQYPTSPAAVVATGIVLKRHAWAQRPRVALIDISTGSESRYVAFLRVARAYLEANAAVAARDPHWHVVLAETALAELDDLDQYYALIERGLAVDPGYLQLATTGLDYFAPTPYATADERARKADRRRLQGYLGSMVRQPGIDAGIYARLYWHARAVGYAKPEELSQVFDWPKVVAGMDAVMAANPDDWNADNFARLACEAQDFNAFRRFDALRKGPPTSSVWRQPELLKACARGR